MSIYGNMEEIENCLLTAPKPSETLRHFAALPWFALYPFSLLKSQMETEQSPLYHPEGNVWNHTLLVVNEAAARKQYSTDARVFMWAALLHDLGEKLSAEFLSCYTEDKEFIEQVSALVRYHMHLLYVLNDMSFKKVDAMKQRTNVQDLALLALCDRLGRTGADGQTELEDIRQFFKKLGIESLPEWCFEC